MKLLGALLLGPLLAPVWAQTVIVGSLATVAIEREANLAAFREHYLPIKEHLLAAESPGFVCLVGGQLLPVDEQGRVVPAATLELADRAARAAVPDANHRYLWRVGEEGEIRYFLGMAEGDRVIGRSLALALSRSLKDAEWWCGANEGVFVKVGDKTLHLGPRGSGPPMVETRIAPPATGEPKAANFLYSTAFDGYATLDAATADLQGLTLWEIPGTMVLNGDDTRPLRRARARFSFADNTMTARVPIGIAPTR